jgi:hypothetical protein
MENDRSAPRGRTVGAVGVPQQPNVFYIGVNNGGVWKTTDFGRTWFPFLMISPPALLVMWPYRLLIPM